MFEIDYVKYTFERKFVEVETVAHIIVSRNRFRVVAVSYTHLDVYKRQVLPSSFCFI